MQTLNQDIEKPKVDLNLDNFVWGKVDAAFAKYDINKDGKLSMEEAREFISKRCRFEYGKDPSEEEIA